MKLPAPRRTGQVLSVGIPASTLSVAQDLREETALTGLVGRAAAIFRVDRIFIYRDVSSSDQDEEAARLKKLLEYLDTPPYLRKSLYPIDDDLRYVGILPPLRTPHHPLQGKLESVSSGDLRMGIVLSSGPEGSEVEIGLEEPVSLIDPLRTVGDLITVKMLRVDQSPLARLAYPREIEAYWGYQVFDCRGSLGSLLTEPEFDLKVGTSKRGDSWSEVAGRLGERYAKAKNILLLFGSYREGLMEILSHEKLKLDDVVHFTVNTIPLQGTATVRTEEALFASLALLRVLG